MKANMLLSLIKAQVDGDADGFKKTALQIAAQEASLGHTRVANELRELVDRVQSGGKAQHVGKPEPTPIVRPNGELKTLLNASYPTDRIRDMVLDKETQRVLKRILNEQHHRQVFSSYDLSPRRKFLLVGPPGCGKTSTAKMLAGELNRPLFVVRLEGLLSRYMGETSVHLSSIFDAMKTATGVYLFDEFDSIGTFRGDTRDIGEVRRVLSTFLQLIENDNSDSIIVAATNYDHMLDDALFRRFDDVIEFPLPNTFLLGEYLKKRLEHVVESDQERGFAWGELAETAKGLSFADVARSASDALKEMLMSHKKNLSKDILESAIKERLFVNKRISTRS